VTESEEQTEAKTPTSTPRPTKQEMHPARYQSSLKKEHSAQRFALTDADFPLPPTTINSGMMLPPSSPAAKVAAKRQSFAAPDFEFKFRQSTDMSNEAQRLMDEVREQAARIKGELEKGREQQERNDDEVEARYGRKMATPKSKNGRYSNVHKEEFNKMGSIASHASTYRAGVSQSSSSRPMTSTTTATTKIPLKPEATVPSMPKSAALAGLKRNTSVKSMNEDEDDASNPAKRRRTNVSGLINRFENSSRPQSRSATPTVTSWNASRIATPTKSSLARADSIKSLKDTGIPVTAHSTAIKPFSTPIATRTFDPQSSTKKARTSFVQRLNSIKPLKSVLRRPNFHYSNRSLNLATGTHVTTPKASTNQSINDQNIEKLLPDVHLTIPASPAQKQETHVNFSPQKDERSRVGTPNTPSPTKATAIYPTLNLSLDQNPASPTPAGSTMSSSRARASIAGTSDFTFRSNQVFNFSPERRINPAVAAAVARSGTPTIRRVRASDASYLINTNTSPSRLTDFPNVAHGLSNKKRKRHSAEKQRDALVFGNLDSTNNSDKENAGDKETLIEQGSPTKKMKMSLPRPTGNVGGPLSGAAATRAARAAGKSKIPMKRTGAQTPGKSKPVMSLSRLTALARPKDRG